MKNLSWVRSRGEQHSFVEKIRFAILLALVLFMPLGAVLSAPQEKSSAGPPMAKPEAVGFSADLPQRVHDAVKKHIDAGDVPGAVVLVARNEKVAYWEAQGIVDAKSPAPLQKDTVFWIASMTKPIVATSVMMMVEEGKISLDDPVYKYIPEFKTPVKVRVLKPGSPPEPVFGVAQPPNAPKPQYDYAPSDHPITINDVLTHTSGIQSIGVPKDELPPPLQPGDTLATRVPKYSGMPLDFQPGKKWAYSNSVGYDILARIVEITSGQTFKAFVQQRIFDPLGMKDSSFGPRTDLASRNMWMEPARLQAPEIAGITYFSGTAGLWVPADDYWRFSEMLLNKGTWNGKHLLKASSVEQMSSNHVGGLFAGFGGIPSTGMGFGYSMEVVLDHTAATLDIPNGSFGWNGVGTRQFWVIPQEKMVIVMYVPSGKAPLVHRAIENAVVSSLKH